MLLLLLLFLLSLQLQGFRGLRLHQLCSAASNLDDLRALFTKSKATYQQQTNYADDDPPSPQQEKITVKHGLKLLNTKEEWQKPNMYFHANLDLHSHITNIENKVCVFQSCVYDYFKLIEKIKHPDHTKNSLFTEYNHLSGRQQKYLKVPPTLIILQEFNTLGN